MSVYSLDVINIVLAKQTNVIGIVISVERAFVKPKIANATINAENESFRFFLQSLLCQIQVYRISYVERIIATGREMILFDRRSP